MDRDCNKAKHISKTLIIEESVRTQGLAQRFLNIFDGLKFDLAETLETFLAARASRARSDYLTVNKEHCTGSELFRGCEMAINYLECRDTSHALAERFGF